MKFFFPDSQDQIDPDFNFETERRNVHRVRQRDDLYAHEALGVPAYSGILVSRAIVEGSGDNNGRYTMAQRHRLYRVGVREFFRLDRAPGPRLETIGDCGAFSYANEDTPPVTVEEVLDFYTECRFDMGVSIDHVILGFKMDAESTLPGFDAVPEDWRRRQAITLELANEFLKRHGARRCAFEPVGAAQGWSPESYAHSVEELQKMGYRRIGLGGMVPLKTHEIMASLAAVDRIRRPETQLHLFGVTRCDHVEQFANHGVTSFDSTSPFRQSFKDDRDNYYTLDRTYTAIRVPQVDGNPSLVRRIRAGQVDQRLAIELERASLQQLAAYDAGSGDLDQVLQTLRAYDELTDGRKDRTATNREALEDSPWKRCPCAICRECGIQVIIFRGTERNKRRGFHNVFVFNERLDRHLAAADMPPRDRGRIPNDEAGPNYAGSST